MKAFIPRNKRVGEIKMRRKTIRLAITVLLVISMLAACGKKKPDGPTEAATATPTVSETTPAPTEEPSVTPTEDPKTNTLQITASNLPRVDGALALEPFYDAVFADLMGISVEDAKLFLPCNNTPGAYKNLTEGKCDMIFCALPSDEQVQTAKDAGVEICDCYSRWKELAKTQDTTTFLTSLT